MTHLKNLICEQTHISSSGTHGTPGSLTGVVDKDAAVLPTPDLVASDFGVTASPVRRGKVH